MTENVGHETNGGSKSRGIKLQDMKQNGRNCRHENADMIIYRSACCM